MNTAPPLTRQQIAGLIPHRGEMCLLDRVVNWDERSIEATAWRHHDPRNPMLDEGELKSVCLVEYAAQAAAVHAALNQSGIGGERAAFIGAVKSLVLHRETVARNYGENYTAARTASSRMPRALSTIFPSGPARS